MKTSRTLGYLLGTMLLALGTGEAAWATDHSGTLDFSKNTTTASFENPFGGTITGDVGVDLNRYDLGHALSGSAVDVSFTTNNSFNPNATVLGLVFTTDPNDAIVSDPTSLAAFINPTTDMKAFLDAHVAGWTYFGYGSFIAPNEKAGTVGTADISSRFSPPMSFTAGTTYYAFVVGGSTLNNGTLTNPSVGYTLSVGAVPEPEDWSMMAVGLGLLGLLLRRRTGSAPAA